MSDKFITIKEAAHLLNVSEITIRNMIMRGSLHAKKADPKSKGVYHLVRSEVESFSKSKTIPKR